jgi:uncharacterized repeat protein (TIGR01451 family)
MSKTFFKISIGLLVLAALVRPSAAALPGMVALTGHVPAAVSQVASTGRLSSATDLHLALGLPLRNQAAMTALLQQIYDPTSTNYHRYLSPAEFTDQFGPTASDYQAVITFAQANGLTVSATHPNRLILDVIGSAANIEAAFQIELHTFNHPTDARTFYAPTTEPVVSASLPILHISGLDNYYVPRPKMIAPSQITNSSVKPNAGSGPGGTYIGSDFRKTYAPGSPLTGAGQSVGLLQFDGFFPSDIATYAALAGITNPPNVITVPVDGGVSFPGGGNGEVAMDIEMIMAMAPGVSNIYVYECPNSIALWPDILNQMANDNLAKQLSCSWGGGPQNPTAEQIFQQMALQGQSFYNASGDTDAFVTGVNPITFPSDSPNITQVGGTVLTTAAGAVYTSEVAWNDHFPRPPGYQGTSGGISSVYSIPSWQQGVNMSTNHGSATFRNIPDVALTSLDVFVVTDNGVLGSSGGTSSAAPLWAGFTALINQQAVINSKPFVGFINPALYTLGKSVNYNAVFNDCTNGDNTWPGSPTNFFAVAGFDLCTGWGSPKGSNLINALVGTFVTVTNGGPIISAPRSPWGNTMGVFNGSNPNGSWYLFVQDDKQLDVGAINAGWQLNLTSANPVGFASDNQLFSTPDLANVNLNSTWTVSVNVTNYGPSDSTNVVVTDVMPLDAGLSYVSSAASQGSIIQFGSSLVWSVGNLSTNTGATMNVTFGATAIGFYTNTASVSSSTLDPNPDDDNTLAIANVSVFTPPGIAGVTFAGGRPTIAVTNASGATTMIVQATTNLVAPIIWQSLYTTNAAAFTFTDFGATNYPYRFYRAILGP